jgi:hypothetical protein
MMRFFPILLLAASFPLQAAAQQPGGIEPLVLDAPTLIDGIPCDASGSFLRSRPVMVYPSGRLASCQLATETEVFGHTLPAETRIFLREDGSPRRALLSMNTFLQGVICRGGGRRSHETTFHENGSLMACWLFGDQEIQGIPCRGSSFWGDLRHGDPSVIFRDDGELQSCQASRSITHQGRRFTRGDRVVVEN